MSSVMFEHKVADYAQWKKIYDADAPTRQKHGLTNDRVYQRSGNPNDVCIVCELRSEADLQKFMADPVLKKAMERGGVQGQPRVTILDTKPVQVTSPVQ